MGATPPVAPQSSVRRLACGTVCTAVEYGNVKEIELYHFQPFVRRGRTRPRHNLTVNLYAFCTRIAS